VTSPVFDHALLDTTLLARVRDPAILTWSRLEPRPRTPRFERSLAAEVRDALWLLARQWQFGEFTGDDAGSPVSATLHLTTAAVTGHGPRDEPLQAYDPRVPLEVTVERERVPLDLRLRVEVGLHWLRLLRARLGADSYRRLYAAAYPLEIPPRDAGHAGEASHVEGMQWRAATAGRLPDGGKLLDDLRSGRDAAEVTAGALAVAPADKGNVRGAAEDLRAWFTTLFTQPEAPADEAWVPSRLEYQFRCRVPEPGGGATTLGAEEYYQGRLDWYSVDSATSPPIPAEEAAPAGTFTETATDFLPTPVEFAGMPTVRWWEFEDRRIDFGAVDAHSTDLSTLLLLEFALAFGNDWSVIPCTVPAGRLCRVDVLVVIDDFGQRTLVPLASRSAETSWHRWSMFGLSRPDGTVDQRLLVAPTVQSSLQGADIETVRLVRDEMANMVWGVEATIPDELGGGRNGYEAGVARREFLSRLGPPAPPAASLPNEAKIWYRLESTVPENWIPFIPVRVPGSSREIQLQRAAMPRAIPGLPTVPVAPRGAILTPLPVSAAPYFVHEEEVPRAGATVTRGFQRARGTDGATYLWLGRTKTTGRGEGSSGLAFDWIEPKE
jgi:hypothetical protein